MKINQTFVNEAVRRSVLVAYNEDTRQLDFRAMSPVSIDVAVKIMAEALGVSENEEGYNSFKPSILRKLPKGSQIILAREGSVCVYVQGNVKNTVKADEHEYIEARYPLRNVTRLWWD
jgi:hypothetical protein